MRQLIRHILHTAAAVLPAAALILSSAESCSVKEVRRTCPCYVTVTTDGSVHRGHSGGITACIFTDPAAHTLSGRGEMTFEDFLAGRYNVAVGKGWFMTSVIGGSLADAVFDRDSVLRIPFGCQCDSICGSVREDRLLDDDDFYTVRMPLDKQFCTLTMNVMDFNPGGESSVRVKGSYDGLRLLDMAPHAGSFQYDPERNDAGMYTVRLPRQGDDGLTLELWSGRAPSPIYGALTYTVPLGSLIARTGYSWTSASLDDLFVEVDYVKAYVRISVGDWEQGTEYRLSM